MNETINRSYKNLAFTIDDELYYKALAAKKRMNWSQVIEEWLHDHEKQQ
jgi:hypothetical protein